MPQSASQRRLFTRLGLLVHRTQDHAPLAEKSGVLFQQPNWVRRIIKHLVEYDAGEVLATAVKPLRACVNDPSRTITFRGAPSGHRRKLDARVIYIFG